MHCHLGAWVDIAWVDSYKYTCKHTGWVDKDKCATLGEPTHCKLHSATVCHTLLNTFDDDENGDWSHTWKVKKCIGWRTNVASRIFFSITGSVSQWNFDHKRRWDKKKRALPYKKLSTSRNFTAKLDCPELRWMGQRIGRWKVKKGGGQGHQTAPAYQDKPPKPPPKPENYLHLSLLCISLLHALSHILTHTPDPGKSFLHEIVKREKVGGGWSSLAGNQHSLSSGEGGDGVPCWDLI